MEQHWLVQKNNSDLIVFTLGWAADTHLLDGIRPEGYDLFCTYDYRTIEPVSPLLTAPYRRVYLFGWSFGVWVAELALRGIHFYKAVALNGTPLPINNRYGISPKAFRVTLDGLQKAGIEIFNRRTYGPYYDSLGPLLNSRPFEEKYIELQNLFELSSKAYRLTIQWDEAVVGEKDLIFPPLNMQAYWQEESPATELTLLEDLPHYPFGDPSIVLNRLTSGVPGQTRHHER